MALKAEIVQSELSARSERTRMFLRSGLGFTMSLTELKKRFPQLTLPGITVDSKDEKIDAITVDESEVRSKAERGTILHADSAGRWYVLFRDGSVVMYSASFFDSPKHTGVTRETAQKSQKEVTRDSLAFSANEGITRDAPGQGQGTEAIKVESPSEANKGITRDASNSKSGITLDKD